MNLQRTANSVLTVCLSQGDNRARNLKSAASVLQADLDSVPSEFRESVRGILGYIVLQLSRLEAWITGDVDMLAWVARNLLEAECLLVYVLGNETNMRRFVNEKDIDVREVLTLSLRTSVYERSKDHGRIAEYVAQRIETRTRESGLPLKRLEAVKVADSDPLVYKLCSKFIHPSAFLIATLQDRLMDDTFRRMFAAFALGCAANALEHNRQATRRSA